MFLGEKFMEKVETLQINEDLKKIVLPNIGQTDSLDIIWQRFPMPVANNRIYISAFRVTNHQDIHLFLSLRDFNKMFGTKLNEKEYENIEEFFKNNIGFGITGRFNPEGLFECQIICKDQINDCKFTSFVDAIEKLQTIKPVKTKTRVFTAHYRNM